MKERVILHSDLNSFYASVECLHNPDIRAKPVAVCGDAEQRHGIVLAKNHIAKQYGIKTGDVIWEAKQKCRELVTLSANYPLYLKFSELAKKIYRDYTDKVESFGIDECWLDITGADGRKTADEIRERIKFELGITASIGVSWNKIFAKLGSDMKKPDATIIIDKQNYVSKIYKLPVEDLLYVGRATKQKLNKCNIMTIGNLVDTDVNFLKSKLGKWGEYLWSFANGYDLSPVCKLDENIPVKSVGNSSTAVRDLKNIDDVRMLVTVLSESLAQRLREQSLRGQVINIYVRDNKLEYWGKQRKIDTPTFTSHDIIETAMQLFCNFYDFQRPIRSIGVSISELCLADSQLQTGLFPGEETRQKRERIEYAIDEIRNRFGHYAINRGIEYLDRQLTGFSPKEENVIHPYSYF